MGRSPCCSKEGVKRGAWSAQEDEILASYIKTHGEGKWRDLPKRAGLRRCGKSCRLRWLNYLRPDIKRGNISPEEEDLIIRLHKLLGNRWSLIAGRLPGRTDNEIKNYWNTCLGKRMKAKPFSSCTSTKEEGFNSSQWKQQPTENSSEPEPQQVIQKKATGCTEVLFPPQQQYPIVTEEDKEPGLPEIPSLLSPPEENRYFDFLVDFNLDAAEMLDYSNYMQTFGDETREQINGIGGDYVGRSLSSSFDGPLLFGNTEEVHDDWKEGNLPIQNWVALELEMLGLRFQ